MVHNEGLIFLIRKKWGMLAAISIYGFQWNKMKKKTIACWNKLNKLSNAMQRRIVAHSIFTPL